MEEQEYEGGLHNKIFLILSQLLDDEPVFRSRTQWLKSVCTLVIPSVFPPKEPMDIYWNTANHVNINVLIFEDYRI